MEPQNDADISLVSKEEAIAEVRRWLQVEKVDPEGIFSAAGDQVIRYKDLVAHLEQETPEGKLLRFAISRGRVMKSERSRTLQHLLQIARSPAAPGGEQPPDPTSSDASGPPVGKK
jgi:hypothetical protein